MKEVNIRETYTLPSRGKIYDEEFNPEITLRSMTTMEEMRKLTYSDSEYKVMSDIIEDCIQEKLPISVYDMCIGDYEFLLHKLRVVTYGSEYSMTIQCPNCGEIVQSTVDLNEIEVHEFDEDEIGDMIITLPITKKKVKLRFQTPRILDTIKEKSKEMKRKSKNNLINYEFLYSITSLIDELDGKKVLDFQLEEIVKKLPLKDSYYILQEGNKLNRKVGLDNSVIAKCNNCGYEIVTAFRLQPEFFRPEIH